MKTQVKTIAMAGKEVLSLGKAETLHAEVWIKESSGGS